MFLVQDMASQTAAVNPKEFMDLPEIDRQSPAPIFEPERAAVH